MEDTGQLLVLITNLPRDDSWTDAAIVGEYKDQSVVEQHFAFIKNPKVVGPMYVKNPTLIQALAYVLLMAVPYSILERALQESGIPLEVYDRRTSLSSSLPVVAFWNTSWWRECRVHRRKTLAPQKLGEIPRLLRLLGLSENIYLSWAPP